MKDIDYSEELAFPENEAINLKRFLYDSILKAVNAEGMDYIVDPRDGEFRASQIPYCSRKIVFSNILPDDVYSVPDSLSHASLGGTIIHRISQSHLAGAIQDIVIEKEIQWQIGKLGLNISGHMDILLLEFANAMYCIDIKTTASLTWLRQRGAPNKHHMEQIMIYIGYLKSLEKYKDKTIRGAVWYLLRTVKYNTSIMDVLINPEYAVLYDFDFDKNVLNNLILKIHKVYTELKEDKLPEIIQDTNEKWQCENKTAICRFHNLCYLRKLDTLTDVMEHLDQIQ